PPRSRLDSRSYLRVAAEVRAEQTARALVRLAARRRLDPERGTRGRGLLAPLDRRGRLLIAARRLGRRTAPLRNAGHDDLDLGVAALNRQRVADLHLARRLHALAVDAHVSAADRLGRDAARLVEART